MMNHVIKRFLSTSSQATKAINPKILEKLGIKNRNILRNLRYHYFIVSKLILLVSLNYMKSVHLSSNHLT